MLLGYSGYISNQGDYTMSLLYTLISTTTSTLGKAILFILLAWLPMQQLAPIETEIDNLADSLINRKSIFETSLNKALQQYGEQL